jgi:hypothetical protein
MVLGSFYGGLGLEEVKYLLLGFFSALFDGSGGEARVKSFEFEEALNCIISGFTFASCVTLLVNALLDIHGSRMLRSKRWR